MLNTVAERILVRATRAASEAEAAIDMLSDSDGEPCSTANIALMQREVFNMLTRRKWEIVRVLSPFKRSLTDLSSFLFISLSVCYWGGVVPRGRG
ncbi:CSS-motif domain-containing protein [Agrobacterium rosae]|nr:CSS-motif domain-containing protein [Agrobacterium rosae]POO51723.1 hypothetical protein CTT39_21880 [Agrobacterium rosae]